MYPSKYETKVGGCFPGKSLECFWEAILVTVFAGASLQVTQGGVGSGFMIKFAGASPWQVSEVVFYLKRSREFPCE